MATTITLFGNNVASFSLYGTDVIDPVDPTIITKTFHFDLVPMTIGAAMGAFWQGTMDNKHAAATGGSIPNTKFLQKVAPFIAKG